MRVMGVLVLCVLSSSRITGAGPWDLAALKQADVKPAWGTASGLVREVTYSGEPFGGHPTRVFAYLGKPAIGTGPFPAVLLVHGGGGKAFSAWAEHWALRGYCALAMDLAGNGPAGRLPNGGPDQSDEIKFKDFHEEYPHNMWTYHAVAAIVRGHNLLRSLPQVDRNRIGITGISWGGYLTCIVSGLDDRLKAAVPVYGCGFLHENSAWKESRLDRKTAVERARWVSYFDPSVHLGNTRCPILFLNGTNDFAYPMDSHQKSFDLVPGEKILSMRVRLPHGHIWTFGEVDSFMDSHLKHAAPLAKLGPIVQNGDVVLATLTSSKGIKEIRLHYAKAEGPWQKREWKTKPAEYKDGIIRALLPEARPLACELSAVDDRGLEVTTRHLVIPGKN